MNAIKLLGTLSCLVLATGSMTSSFAEDIPGTPLKSTQPSDAFLEWLGQWNKLYKADKSKNSVVQELNLSLRMQYQAGWTDPNGDGHSQGGGHDDGFRRFRLGGNAKLFNGNLKLVNIWDVGGVPSGRAKDKSGTWRHQDSRAHLYELYAAYDASPVEISLGKVKPAFTSEYRTSSSAIITVERSVLVNQLRSETNWGLQFKNSDKKDKVGWLLGAYLNAEGGCARGTGIEMNSEDSAFLLGSISYDTSGFVTEKGRLWLDYAHNFTDYVGNDPARPKFGGESNYKGTGAEDVLVLSWDMEEKNFSFVTELLGGFSVTNAPTANAGDVWGIVLMPSYKFTPNWEGVARYQYANGEDAVKVEKRYATTTTTSTKYADELHAFYLGVNYYVDSDNPNMMKIMLGAEYSDYINDKGADQKYAFTGWTYYLSFRTNF